MKLRNATGTLRWQVEDDRGESPLGEPTLLTFHVGFYFNEGSPQTWDYPGDPDEVQFVGFTLVEFEYMGRECDGISVEGCPSAGTVENWFESYVDNHLDEYARMREAAIEQLAGDQEPPEREKDE